MRLSVERVDYSYEQVLGSLGAYVDQRACSSIRVAESPDGFEVECRAGTGTVERIQFDFGEISDGSVTCDLSSSPGSEGYREFLAALGRELDSLSARKVSIEDVDQVMVVSYWYEHPSADFVSQHREFALGPEERRNLLRAEQTRRQLSITR